MSRLQRIVEAHFEQVWRTLRRLGVPAGDVDDAAQKVFLVAARKLDTIGEKSERAFLLSTALNVAATLKRSIRRRSEVAFEEALEVEDPTTKPDEMIDRRRASALFDAVIEAMPMDLRVVFVLFELEEMTMADIATTLALPPGTVASRLRRARSEFHARVKRLQAKRGVK